MNLGHDVVFENGFESSELYSERGRGEVERQGAVVVSLRGDGNDSRRGGVDEEWEEKLEQEEVAEEVHAAR